MIRIDDLALFVRAAALGSFSNAAREVDLLPGQVSAAIGRLERELDIRLFARSTRSLRLSSEGERYLPYAQEVLATLREGREHLRGPAATLEGSLQISMPSDLGRNLLLPWLDAFSRQHPGLALRLAFSDHVTDVFRDPVDVAIRLGRFDQASYVTLPLAEHNQRVLVAAPEYVQRHGMPGDVDALRGHECLPYLLGHRVYDRWAFLVDGRKQVVQVRGGVVCDDADAVRRLALAGRGIAYKSWLDVAADVADGRLLRLLPGCGEPVPAYLVCPHRRQFSPAIRSLHQFLGGHFQEHLQRYPLEDGARAARAGQ